MVSLSFKTRMIILASFIAIIAICCFVMFLVTYEKFDPVVLQERKDQSAAAYGKFAKIYDENDIDTIVQLPDCSESMFTLGDGNEVEYVNFIEYDQLEKFTRPQSDWENDSKPVVKWLESPSFGNLKPVDQLTTMWNSNTNISNVEDITKWKYIGVYYTVSFSEPKENSYDDDYIMGEYQSILGIADLETGKVICSDDLASESSPTFSAPADEFQSGLEKDMKDNTIKELKRHIDAIGGGKLKVSGL